MSTYCKNCGKEMKDDAQFCEGCGTKVETINSNNSSSPINAGKSNFSSKLNTFSKKRFKIGNKQIPFLPVIIAAALILVIVIAKLGFGSSSYETPFNNFEKAINQCDSNALQDSFLPSVVMAYQLNKLTDNDLKGEFEDISVKIVITNKERIKGDEISDVISDLNLNSNISASDCYIVSVKNTLNNNGKISTKTIKDIVVIKVNGKWYFATDDLLNSL